MVASSGKLWSLRIILFARPSRKRSTSEGQQGGPPPVDKKAEKADANEALGQDMRQEPSQEFVNSESHLPLLVPVGIVFPAERDLAVLEGDQATVRDGDAMDVTGQVVEERIREIKSVRPFKWVRA
jgi:hypothetical protein